MVSTENKVKTDPLFLGLTRPTIVLGVTYGWFGLEGFIWTIYFINTSDFLWLILGFVITHTIGFMLCSYEPRFLELITIGVKTNSRCTNKFFHGNTNSYDVY